MQEPKKAIENCEVCGKEFIYIDPIFKEPYHSWELTTIKHQKEIYLGPLAGQGYLLEYSVCRKCFFNRLLPAMQAAGLPKKNADIWMS